MERVTCVREGEGRERKSMERQRDPRERKKDREKVTWLSVLQKALQLDMAAEAAAGNFR